MANCWAHEVAIIFHCTRNLSLWLSLSLSLTNPRQVVGHGERVAPVWLEVKSCKIVSLCMGLTKRAYTVPQKSRTIIILQAYEWGPLRGCGQLGAQQRH